MNNNTFSYLNFINFSQLNLWDFKRYATRIVDSKFPIVKLSDYIREENSKIKPFENPEEEYEILGVNNKTGLFDAYIEKGSKINQPYKIVKDGFLTYNPYRINVGSIGLKTKNQKYKYISPAYVVFSCKKGLLPEFLYILFRTNKFNELIRDNTTGSVRQTLSFTSMGNIRIPLPSLEIQAEFVKKYNDKIKLAEEQEQKAKVLENNVEEYIEKQLGINCTNNITHTKEYRYLTFYDLTDLSRWDLYKNDCNSFVSSKYKFSKLANIVTGKPLYGAGEKGVKKKSDIRYIRITDINEDGTLNDDFVSAEKVDSKYLLEEDDFLIARSGNTVGKTFLYKKEFGKCIYAGYLIKFKLDTQKIIPEYLLYYTKSNIYKQWIASNQRANAQPNINSNEYLESPIIVPSIEEQRKIVNELSKIKEQIRLYKKQAEQNRVAAQEEFEKELFE
uniref:Type I restriction modification DNA specificity domain-containing protein n=1 Tax=uncultured Candidatus Melainabacteria bacterium TaxID=2682970 RepID=A0A650EJ89_9BACT|nr:hypothetical protein Melaina855_1460 [uncultured Candidatus Melainabacteria bacterium]